MKHLNSYNKFDNINENIFKGIKKWFEPSDEEKKKWGYVKNDKGEWVHPDDKISHKNVKKNKPSERDLLEGIVANIEPKKIKNINYERGLHNYDYITFELKNESLIKFYKNDGYSGTKFEFDGKQYNLGDIIDSVSYKLEVRYTDGKVDYTPLKSKFYLKGNDYGTANNYRSDYEGDVRNENGKWVLNIKTINERDDNQTLDQHINYVVSNVLRVTDFWRMTSLLKESFKRRKEDLKDELIRNNLQYVIECFYDLSDLSDKHSITEKNGEIVAKFEIEEIEVESQKKSKYVSSYGYGGTARVSFDEAHFRLNEKTSKVFGILSEVRPRVEDQIDGCRFDVIMKNGKIKIIIS